jgi:hypothetical protein
MAATSLRDKIEIRKYRRADYLQVKKFFPGKKNIWLTNTSLYLGKN